MNRRFLGIDRCDEFLELSKARRLDINTVSKRIEYLEKLQSQSPLFEDNDYNVLNDSDEYYGSDLPF